MTWDRSRRPFARRVALRNEAVPVLKQQRRILPVIVGTAGHVDHGKTALVRNLTGCETDTLREEKQRQMTIDLGFAPCALSGGRLCGIIDVPGHEDFIRNMVAGASSMDIVMLVVAADDGVMPQTIEHLQIVKLLRMPKVLVVITKSDLVDADTLALARQEVAEFISTLGLPDAPIVCVSNRSLEGIQDVVEGLQGLVDSAEERAGSGEHFRMNVERSFSVKGHGTVVTGIPMTGRIRVGDRVELLPSGACSSVRAIQSYKIDAQSLEAHVCGAILLRDIDANEVRRGVTIAAPGVYEATASLIATVSNVSKSLRVKKNSELRFHCGTSVTNAVGRLIDCSELLPGQDAFMQLRLDEPIVLSAGDKYLLRVLSARATLGGGTVLSVRKNVKLKASSPIVMERLNAARRAVGDGDCLAAELLVGRSGIVEEGVLRRYSRLTTDAAEQWIEAKERQGEIINLGGDGWLVARRRREVNETVKAVLKRYHDRNLYAWGMEPAHVCRLLGLDRGSAATCAALVSEDPGVVLRNGRLAISSFSPRISEKQMQLREQIVARVKADGVKPPARGDLMNELGIEEQDMRLLTRLLAEEGTVKVIRTNLLLRSLFDEFREKLLDLFKSHEVVDIESFRNATGVSRKIAQAVLETFDSEGVTRRVDNGRVLIRTPMARRSGSKAGE